MEMSLGIGKFFQAGCRISLVPLFLSIMGDSMEERIPALKSVSD